MPTLKEKLADGTSRIVMPICTIPSPIVVQTLAAAGCASVIVDLEHGAIDYGTAKAMIAATAGTDCAPLVRIAENTDAQVKRAMDLGAEGIMFPLIRDAEEAAWAVSSLRYPPHGHRSFGPFIAAQHFATTMPGYPAVIAERAICCLLAETVEAIDNIEEICAVPGVDLVVPAPFDLSTALGDPGNFEAPAFVEAMATLEAAITKVGLPMGSIALNQAAADALFARGHRVIASADVLWLRAAAAEAVSWCQTP